MIYYERMENLNNNTEQILTNIERDNILRILFEWKDWKLDAAFLYKWKWAELYEKASTDENYPFINIEIEAIDELKHESKFEKILGKTDFITDVWSWDGQKAITLLKWTRWHGKYIAEDPSEDMLKIVKKNMLENAPNIELWNSQVLNNQWHLSSNCPNNMYLFLWGTIWNFSDDYIINELKNMDNNWIINGNKILLSYFTAPETQEDVDNLIKIYGSEKDRAFHENGIDMLWLSRDNFEYDVVYEKDNPEQKEWPFPWKIKWIIRAKRDNIVTLSSWRELYIKEWQEFTMHYSRRFTKEWIEELFKKSGCKTELTIDKNWVSVVLLSKKPTRIKAFVKKNQKVLLTALVWLWIWVWGTTAVNQYQKIQQRHRQDYLRFELEIAGRSIDQDYQQEIDELVSALMLDELKDKKDKEVIINLFNKYVEDHKQEWTSTDDLIKWFYKEYWWILINNLGLTHSPYDFMTPISMITTKKFEAQTEQELSLTPTYCSDKTAYFWGQHFKDYWIYKATTTISRPFKYNDWWNIYLIVKVKILDSYNTWDIWNEIYMAAEKDWWRFSEFSTYNVKCIKNKSWLDSKIISNTAQIWRNIETHQIEEYGIEVWNHTGIITLNNDLEDLIIKTGKIANSAVDINKLYIRWKLYYIMMIPTYSWNNIWLASTSTKWPFTTTEFNKISEEFSRIWKIPLDIWSAHWASIKWK